LLDFAGVPVPKEVSGQSWRPLLTKAQPNWRSSWFYEYFAEKQKGSRVPDITAVRTVDAKLIKYPGHEEWTELFDLKNDPYELRNLFADPAHASLRLRLEREHTRLASELGYRVPDYVDRPEGWGKPGGPDALTNALPGLRLDFDFAKLDGQRVPDSSGQGNHGTAHNVQLVEGREGRRALQLGDGGYVEVPKSESLSPAGSAWTVEAVINPQLPDGVILARGGRSQGYALWIREGRPAFTVIAGNKTVILESKKAIEGWTTVTGTIKADHTATLHVNGQLAGSAALPNFIQRDPNDAMQIGADMGSLVVESSLPKFTGSIERVRIFSGEARP
jgi:hypothetical protein